MKKFLLLLIALAAICPQLAHAQSQRNPCYYTGANPGPGVGCVPVSSANPLPVATTTTSGAPLDVEGNVAAGTTDTGNPVKIGGVYNTTTPTLTAGQRGDIQVNANGAVRSQVILNSATGADGQSNTIGFYQQSGTTGTPSFLLGSSSPYNFNGTNWDRQFTCPNSAVVSATAGATTQIVALSGSTNIRVCSIVLTISASGTAQFVSGTGTNCATGTANLTGAMSLATATPLALSSGNGSLLRAGASNALCLAAVTGNVTGFVTYAQY